jgi:hypothetical protein
MRSTSSDGLAFDNLRISAVSGGLFVSPSAAIDSSATHE